MNMPIRVLHVFSPNYSKNFSGHVIRWKKNFSHWDNQDVTHHILDTSKNQTLAAREAFDFKIPENRKIMTKWKKIAWILPLFRNLSRYKGEYDILHVHTLWWWGLLIGPWAKLNNIPAIYESVLFGSDNPGTIRKQKFSKIKLTCLKSYRKIVTVSPYLTEDFLKYGYDNGQVSTLQSSVDSDLFLPANTHDQKKSIRLRLGLPINAKIVLFVGAVTKRKGVDILVNSFIKASSHRSDLYLIIVGGTHPADESYFDQLLYILNENRQLSNKYLFAGLVQDNRLVADYYRAADIFVFPSFNEGLPNVVLEAMASELPVVVSQLPFLENVIEHGENGFFIPIGDVEAVKNSILSLCINPSLAKMLGKNARAHVRNNYTFSSWQNQIMEVYVKLANTAA
jgi:glycosyltransferase involved in cell wall biosynthesis